MKRVISKLALFLLLGAIINIAIAWGSALWVDSSDSKFANTQMRGNTAADHPRWSVLIFPGSSSTIVQSGAFRNPYPNSSFPVGATRDELFVWKRYVATLVYGEIIDVPYWSRASMPPTESDYEVIKLTEEARGWPMRSLVWHYSRRVSDGVDFRKWSIDLENKRGPIAKPRALPLLPIPLGFSINTVLNALCMWALFAAIAKFRESKRIKSGCCLKCGYDLRGSSGGCCVCPECGNAGDEV